MRINWPSNIKASFLGFWVLFFGLTNWAAAADPSSAPAKSTSSLLKPPAEAGLTINWADIKANGSVTFNEAGFFFYSNNPEAINQETLADKGYWLNRAEVSGKGQVYTWHTNKADKEVTSSLFITNTNRSKDIRVTIKRYGLTNGKSKNDISAWDAYFNGQPEIIRKTIKPGQFIELFKQTVSPYSNFGIIAEVDITDKSGQPAQALMDERVYYKENLKNRVHQYAPLDRSRNRCRGIGESYQSRISFDTVTFKGDAPYVAYSIGARNDSLAGADLITITDLNTGKELPLEGNYGEIMTITLPVRNEYRNFQNYGIFIGSIGGYSFPFVNMGGTSYVNRFVPPFKAYDMIQTGHMPLGTTQTITFDLVIPSWSSTPLVIGVHPLSLNS